MVAENGELMNASAQTRAALSAIALGVTLFPCGAAQGQVRADNGAFVTERISDILENERTGTMVRWSDPKTGDVGTITIERTYEQIDGRITSYNVCYTKLLRS